MSRLVSLAVVAAALAAPTVAGAQSAPYVPDEVVVKYVDGTSRSARAATQRATRTGRPRPTARLERTLKLTGGQSVPAALAALRARPDVEYAGPNYLARAAAFIPNDPGRGTANGWRDVQWNFLPGSGVNAPDAWENLIAAGRPGGAGVVVAVLDTGVAYSNRGRYRRSPDFRGTRFLRGHDFVDHDRHPHDDNGHGTHVAGTIAERTDNGIGLTGLAYGARILPVRVLNSAGEGDSADIARGIRFAARRRAKVINLSLEFASGPGGVTRASQIPEIVSAVRYANRRGALVVGASGNESQSRVAYPARLSTVVAVGATTEHTCIADYSNEGDGLDIVAPGGGSDARLREEADRCRPNAPPGRDVFQITFAGSVRRFGIGREEGTSMAAPHVSATAALVVASGVLGPDPTPRAIVERLQATARDLGRPGLDPRYGAGMLDSAAATAPLPPPQP